MMEILNHEKSEIIPNMVSSVPSYNRIWGMDYLFMDSKTFFGNTGEERYDNLISMFNNIWKAHEYRLLGNMVTCV